MCTYFNGHFGFNSAQRVLVNIHPKPGKKSVRYSISEEDYANRKQLMIL